MSSAAEQIKDRLGIAEVVGSYIKIEKSGANFKACCPFHNEKTPSFYVSTDRNTYYCFGCGAKGDIFTFVQEFEKVDFIGALKLLAEKAGIELAQYKDESKGEMDRLRGVLEMSTKFYQQNLEDNVDALQYLKKRGLTDTTIQDWKIGYALNDWRTCYDNLKAKKISDEDIEAVGLIKWPDSSGVSADGANGGVSGAMAGKVRRPYDRFRARVMFPLFDPSSRVIGYSGRIFGVPDTDGPKYLNSPDTKLFNKSETLYGYHKAKEGIRQWKYVILVEGQMDLLMCHQNGFTNTVATSGTSLTTKHLEKLSKMTDNLMLVYDGDKAGVKATLRAWTEALSFDMVVKVAELPKGEDPADVLLKDKEIFKNSLKNSKNIIGYFTDMLIIESAGDKSALSKKVRSELLQCLLYIESPILRSEYISKISLKTGIAEKDLQEETENLIKKNSTQMSANQSRKIDKQEFVPNANQQASGNHIGHDAHGVISKNDVNLRRFTGLVQWLRSKKDEEKASHTLAKIENILTPEEFAELNKLIETVDEGLIFEAEVLFSGSGKLQQEIDIMIDLVEERFLKYKLSKAMSELHLAEKNHDKIKAENLLKICQELSLKLSELGRKRSESS
jgi:DNA primase